jgi:nitrite reductase (NADH) large subunit
MTYLILGSGASGIFAADRLRELDTAADIIVATKDEAPYYKMYLPDLISGGMKQDRILSKTCNQFKRNKIELLTGHEACGIETGTKKVSFANGQSIAYDKLLIATGTRPYIPFMGIEDMEPATLDSLKGALHLSERIVPLDRVVVIGAGLTGIQTAAALSKAGLHVTVLEKEPILLGAHLNREQSDALVKLMERSNIKVVVSCDIKEIAKGCVIPEKGEAIRFSHLIIACGTIPNIEFLAGNGVDISRGLEINGKYETIIDSVYAAGSVAHCDKNEDCYENAKKQGLEAALCMAGQKPEEVSYMSYPVTLRELDLSYWGDFGLESGYEIIKIKQKDIYKKLVLDNGSLKGFIFIGDSKKTKTALSYVIEKKTVSEIELRELLG